MQYHRQAHACELCPAKFSSPGLLAAHIRIKHLNQRDFKCPQCDYASHYKKDLVAHILGHEGKLFRCEEFGCNVVYRTLLGLKKVGSEVGAGRLVGKCLPQVCTIRLLFFPFFIISTSAGTIIYQHRCTRVIFAIIIYATNHRLR